MQERRGIVPKKLNDNVQIIAQERRNKNSALDIFMKEV